MTDANTTIESVLQEQRVFEPPADTSAKARIGSLDDYRKLYQESIDSPEEFWAREAGELQWQEPWTQVVDWSNRPFAKWFIGGKTNISQNCVDRHLDGPRRDKTALTDASLEEGEWRQLGKQDIEARCSDSPR